jgi:hypothetical protein
MGNDELRLDGTIQIKFKPDKSLVRELSNSNYLKIESRIIKISANH